MGAFPFPRQGLEGLERAARLLAEGCNVVLFPEGTRSADGKLGLFRDGVGRLLLLASQAAAVPVAIGGSHAMWPRGRALPRRGRLEVRFGGPWRPAADLTARAISTELARRVSALGSEPSNPQERVAA
jgi:1-acyl-sn-glycerol-3-phosphate acyltransferase